MADALSIFPAAVLRNLSDKLYEKRKQAALEIEGIVKNLRVAQEHDKVISAIKLLVDEFARSPSANHRKGGLIGLAAVTIALGPEAKMHLDMIVPPVLSSLIDQDSRVRYYACEALYNIAKFVRGELIIFFNQIFAALCKLSADSDESVQSATHFLDHLVKEIVTESDQFSIEEFIPLLRDRMNVLSPFVRQFLVGWITVLDSKPEIDILGFLPDFLDGLFNMLSDSSHEIRQQTDSALSEFLVEIKNSPDIESGRMAEILIRRASSPDAYTRLTAITWIHELLKLDGGQLIHYYADILDVVLPCIADKEEKIRMVAFETNEELRQFHADPADGFNTRSVFSVVRRQLSNEWEGTRVEALRWIGVLLVRHYFEVVVFLNEIFDSLLTALSDSSDEVVLLVLEVHACIARDSWHFRNLVSYLIEKFRTESMLLERRGALIVCRLCVLLGAERMYREIAEILENERDLGFASTMVQAMNLILLTSYELRELRSILKNTMVDTAGKELFLALYSAWCHSPMAIISLCLLGQAYFHATLLIQSLGEEDVNVKLLVQLDKLIRLLETPTFVHLRLQLLEPARHSSLFKCLYGLLMLLPQQSVAFNILQTRLKVVSSMCFKFNNEIRQISPGNSCNLVDESNWIPVTLDENNSINFRTMLQRFQQVQSQHRLHSRRRIEHQMSTFSFSEEIEISQYPVLDVSHPSSQSRTASLLIQ